MRYWELDEHLRYVLHEGTRSPLNAQSHADLTGISRVDHLARSGMGSEALVEHTQLLQRHESFDTTLSLSSEGKAALHVHVVARPILDKNGDFKGYHGCSRDITERVELQQQLLHMANHDELTGIFNRREFHARLCRLHQYVQGTELEFSLCVIDLDRFKLVNDTAGHAAGDRLLIELTELIQSHLEEGETLARLGGDEFGLLLEAPSAHAALRGRRIIAAITSYEFEYGNRRYSVGACIGITSIEHGDDTIAELTDRADSACYAAKNNGRNQCVVFSPVSAAYLAHRKELRQVEIIKEALQANRLQLFVQSIEPGFVADRTSAKSAHYEVLLRLESELGELMAPDTFIPVAERFNIMQDLDKWVLRNCLETLQSFAQKGLDVSLSINLSGNTLSDLSALDSIVSTVRHSCISGQKLCFEITESAAINNIDNVVAFMHQLKQSGVKFALDDFGAGLSSFAYIRSLPIDFLKIDGYFIRNIRSDATNKAITAAFVQLSRELGIKTVAEFVEDKATRKMVVEMGIDYVQGYGVSRPIALSQVLSSDGVKSSCPFAYAA